MKNIVLTILIISLIVSIISIIRRNINIIISTTSIMISKVTIIIHGSAPSKKSRNPGHADHVSKTPLYTDYSF